MSDLEIFGLISAQIFAVVLFVGGLYFCVKLGVLFEDVDDLRKRVKQLEESKRV